MEAAQDMRRSKRQQSKFAVVDPAYGSVAGNASILSVFLPARDVRLLPREAYWRLLSGDPPDLATSVDWHGRTVTVLLGKSPERALHLDLVQFEFLMRSANGLSCRRFFKGEIRRIVSRLALVIASTDTVDEEIRVVYGDKLRTITIDEGNRIICEESS